MMYICELVIMSFVIIWIIDRGNNNRISDRNKIILLYYDNIYIYFDIHI